MVSVFLIIFLLFVHYIFDFILQSDDVATQKSYNPWVLLYHCILYGIGFIGLGSIVFGVMVISHLIIDYFSSQATTYFFKNEKRHQFFCVIGFDQFCHIVVILLVAKYLI